MKRILSVLLCVISLLSLVGCTSQPIYDEGFEAIEERIYSEYKDYIVLNTPTINNDENPIEWEITFKSSYIGNDKRKAETDPSMIMESIRDILNDYVASDSSSVLNDHRVEIMFVCPREHGGSSTGMNTFVGSFRSYDQYDLTLYELFGGVVYSYYNNWEYVKGKDDVYDVYFQEITFEEASEIIDSLANVDLVTVFDDDVESRLQEAYPDVQFV